MGGLCLAGASSRYEGYEIICCLFAIESVGALSVLSVAFVASGGRCVGDGSAALSFRHTVAVFL